MSRDRSGRRCDTDATKRLFFKCKQSLLACLFSLRACRHFERSRTIDRTPTVRKVLHPRPAREPSNGDVREVVDTVEAAQFGDEMVTLVKSAGWFERRFGRRPNAATIYRWATKGVRGVRLSTLAMGRYRYTNEASMERFVAELSQRKAGDVQVAESSTGAPGSNPASGFTKAEIAAATRRRQQEKAKAMEYLQSQLGPGGRNAKAPSLVGNVQRVTQS